MTSPLAASATVLETPHFTLYRGTRPLLVSVPHAGTAIPTELHSQLTPRALQVEDADWHLERLYAFVREQGASLIVPRWARYVVDLNRPPDNTPMYPGANNTELCPTRFFNGDPLYRDGQAPTEAEVAHRRDTYWRPYHQALEDELQRLQAQHGHAVLFDGHSILSQVPWLFEGKLPDLNLGTASGASCAPRLRQALAQVLQAEPAFTHVVDGRFKGGYITRHHGQPARGRHAVQLEMGLSCYMEESAPWRWDPAHAARVQPVLMRLIDTLLNWQPGAGEPT
jgi:N-formylglutamate deformylase